MKKQILMGILVSVMVLSLAGCGRKQEEQEKEPETFIDVSEDGKTVYANFRDADQGTGGGTGIEIGEEEHLQIDSALEKGEVRVKITQGGDDIEVLPSADAEAVFERVYSAEAVTEEAELEAGSYMIFVTVEEKAEGKITFTKKP